MLLSYIKVDLRRAGLVGTARWSRPGMPTPTCAHSTRGSGFQAVGKMDPACARPWQEAEPGTQTSRSVV